MITAQSIRIFENLKLITLYISPPNTTYCLQLMDQGVIRSLKCKYCTHIIKTIINAIDNGKQMPSISILEAMKMLVHPWTEVSESTIINGFRKAGFKEGVSDEDDDHFSALKIQLTNCKITVRILFRMTLPTKSS